MSGLEGKPFAIPKHLVWQAWKRVKANGGAARARTNPASTSVSNASSSSGPAGTRASRRSLTTARLKTAIKVIDGTVEVVSEGHWKLFNP